MRRIWIGLAVVMLLGVSSGVVLAYLSGEDLVENHFQVTDTKIELEEESVLPEKIVPGSEIRKVPKIRNISNSSCYVRAYFHFSDQKARDFCEEIEIKDGWIQKNDGYYYWEEMLQPGEATMPLFENIVIRKDAKEEDITQFTVSVYAEAVQVNGSAGDSWEILTQ